METGTIRPQSVIDVFFIAHFTVVSAPDEISRGIETTRLRSFDLYGMKRNPISGALFSHAHDQDT